MMRSAAQRRHRHRAAGGRRNEDALRLRAAALRGRRRHGRRPGGRGRVQASPRPLLEEAPATSGGEERVVALIQEANRRVYQRSSEDAAASGMGTTMTVALVEDGGASRSATSATRAPTASATASSSS